MTSEASSRGGEEVIRRQRSHRVFEAFPDVRRTIFQRRTKPLFHPFDARFPRFLDELTLLEDIERPKIELAEHEIPPGVPHLGPDRLHVGKGHHVELFQHLDAAQVLREVDDHSIIVKVAVLCDMRHQEMMAHEPFDLPYVVLVKGESARHFFCNPGTPVGVAVAVPLAHVVEQHGKVKNFRAVDLAKDLREQRTTFTVVARAKPFELHDSPQRMLVHRIDVVEIADDHALELPELRQKPPEDADVVHFAQDFVDPAASPQNIEERASHRRRFTLALESRRKPA